jgi:hypothetical protein
VTVTVYNLSKQSHNNTLRTSTKHSYQLVTYLEGLSDSRVGVTPWRSPRSSPFLSYRHLYSIKGSRLGWDRVNFGRVRVRVRVNIGRAV